MLTKEIVIDRIRICFNKIKNRNEPYYVGEKKAMRWANKVISEAQSFGFDDRHKLVTLMDKQMETLELDPGNEEAEGRICGYAVALAMFHDNNREMHNEDEGATIPF